MLYVFKVLGWSEGVMWDTISLKTNSTNSLLFQFETDQGVIFLKSDNHYVTIREHHYVTIGG